MKLYKVKIIPNSNFATTLKGDTLFGQICWAVFYKFKKEKLDKLLKEYARSNPFLVVSDGFPNGFLPKPTMPSSLLNENPDVKKENRKKLWLTLDALKNGHYQKAKTDKEIDNRDKKDVLMHNSLNYKSFLTGGENFDPYGVEEFSLSPREIYFLLDESQFLLKELKEVFHLVSDMGYGKDSSIGKGRFTIRNFEEVKITNNAKTFMALSPFTPEEIECQDLYYEPFTRFGKFGGDRAVKNAFKNPILLANSGSVIHFETPQQHQYIGDCIDNISSTHKDTVHQGYSIVIPIKDLN